MKEDFLNAVNAALDVLKNRSKKEVKIFHHNDCDGLTSGSILQAAFLRSGYHVSRYCLEKPYPAVLHKIFEQKNEFIIFADFAGRIAPIISGLNRGRNLVFILDHHVAERASDPEVFNLDPELFGLKGDRDISASAACYLFARAMNDKNKDLSRLGALGAVGDGFFVDGRLVSVNREVAAEASELGLFNITEPDNGKEEYTIFFNKSGYKCRPFGEYLDVLGGAGYQRGGPDTGVRVCLEGPDTESDKRVAELRRTMEEIFSRETAWLKEGGLKSSGHIQWFNLKNRFVPMGVKMVGVFCEKLKNTDFIDPEKYIAGFQHIPPEIPGLGKIELNDTKISMRVPEPLKNAIIEKRALGLDVLLPEATNRIGGFSDACHSLTAATVVKMGEEESLIEEMENILKKQR
ncbi:MAG: DHH family phosphoesterase [Spirochaetes bacterium]|nr:DHH family phosphoesterase [Spirochaetota bacterium]